MYIIIFSVQGTNDFPVDMLRYDACFPLDQQGVADIVVKSFPPATREDLKTAPIIRLAHHDKVRGWSPTEGRWNSFGWKRVGNVEVRAI